MVNLYYQATKDADFIHENFDILEKEYNFWQDKRSVAVEKDGETYKMSRYNVNLEHPRPEGYREDLEIAEQLPQGLLESDTFDICG